MSAAGGIRWARVVTMALTIALLGAALAVATIMWRAFEEQDLVGIDLRIAVVFAERWASTGSMYLETQLTGPYPARAFNPDLTTLPSLYPPPAVLLFAPFRILPAILWWLVPLAAIAWSIARSRPRPWAWLLIALALAWPNTSATLIAGNTAMWVAAAVAAGLYLGWPAVLVFLKPSFAPFAFAGFLGRRRAFNAAMVGLAGVAVLFVAQWPRYVAALLNADVGPLYSAGDAPLVTLPLIAWLGRSDSLKREGSPAA